MSKWENLRKVNCGKLDVTVTVYPKVRDYYAPQTKAKETVMNAEVIVVYTHRHFWFT